MTDREKRNHVWRWRATNHDVPAVRALLYLRTMHHRNNTAARFARRRWRVLVSRATLYVTEKYHFPDIQFLSFTHRCPRQVRSTGGHLRYFALCQPGREKGKGPPLMLTGRDSLKSVSQAGVNIYIYMHRARKNRHCKRDCLRIAWIELSGNKYLHKTGTIGFHEV